MISNPTWDAIVLLLSSDYPDLTRGKLEKALAMIENEKKLEISGQRKPVIYCIAADGRLSDGVNMVTFVLPDLQK